MRIILIFSLLFCISDLFSQESPLASDSALNLTVDSLVSESVVELPKREGTVPVPEPSERALQYYRTGNLLWVVNTIWGLLIPALFLFTGFSARMRDWVKKVNTNWFVVIVGYFLLFVVFNYVIDFALSYYQGYVRTHAYGLSNQTFGKWFGDGLTNLMISAIGGSLVLWVPYLLLKRSPTRWWFYTGLLIAPFMFLVMLIQPLFIAPMFNDFGPMKDKELEKKILAIADRAGIEGSRVYEVNKSVDTKAVNAYVSGFMGSKRIVLWDTIIDKLDEDELLFVMGHEMGHYVLGHVVRSIVILSLIMIVALFTIHKVSGWVINRYKDRFGFSELSDIASLPLLILLFGLTNLIISPVFLGMSRSNEHEADRFGVEITQTNYAAASAFAKLQEENLANPRPGLLYELWRGSHPSLGDRIDFCNSYRPWEEGKPLRYKHLFREE